MPKIYTHKIILRIKDSCQKERRLSVDIKKIFKGLDKVEAQELINHSSLTLEELALANCLFVERKPRLYFCDDYGCSTGKYHYMLNRVIVKLETALKFKLFGE